MKPRGHWPKNKRRNPPATLLLARLRRILKHPIPGKISRRAIAKKIGVDTRTLCRWLSGEDYPSQEYHARLESVAEKGRECHPPTK